VIKTATAGYKIIQPQWSWDTLGEKGNSPILRQHCIEAMRSHGAMAFLYFDDKDKI
jgi:hypothetical protein